MSAGINAPHNFHAISSCDGKLQGHIIQYRSHRLCQGSAVIFFAYCNRGGIPEGRSQSRSSSSTKCTAVRWCKQTSTVNTKVKHSSLAKQDNQLFTNFSAETVRNTNSSFFSSSFKKLDFYLH